MNNPRLTPKKILIIAGVIIFILFSVFLLLYDRMTPENGNITAPTPVKPTSLQSPSRKNKPIKLPISEDDPRLWIDENGNPIEEVE